MKGALRLAVVAVGISAGAMAFVYSGLADVSATSPHWPLTAWFLSTTMQHSVTRRAKRIDPPRFLDDEAHAGAGAVAFDAMCAGCHGAPGIPRSAAGKGLYPPAPDLAEEAAGWTAAVLFWITKNGVRMTGMPAFGRTHSDEEIWEVVGFVGRLGRLSPSQYRELAGTHGGADGPGHRHEHR
jgi:mono/diheme cytochrome c family protein